MPRKATVTSADDLVSVASSLVVQHGAAGVRLLDLAHAAGVSVGTVYNYFPSKAHLLAAVAARVETAFVEAMAEAAPADAPLRPAVPGLVRALLDTADREPVARVLAELGPTGTSGPDADPAATVGGAAVRQWIAHRVELARRSGEVGDVDAALVAELAFALVRAALLRRGARVPDGQGPDGQVPDGRMATLLGAALTAMLPAPPT
jgi:AcrR family transcriptional regulator